MSTHFVYIWQYTVQPEHRQAFLAAYRPDGEWAQLFSRDPAYIETKLLQDEDQIDRYVTFDYWQSKKARDAFREKYSSEFETLDRRCEGFTHTEEFFGDFVILNGSRPRRSQS